jgi:hypothetical protein
MKGIPAGPGFVDFGVGSKGARMFGGRMVGGGQSVVLAVPPAASLIGAGVRLRWRTRSALSEPLAFPIRGFASPPAARPGR